MTRTSCLKYAAGILVATAVFAAAAAFLVPRLLDPEAYRARIISLAERSLNRPVSYQSASFSFRFGPSFVFKGIVVGDKTEEKPLLAVDRLAFRVALLPLLHKELRLSGIDLERPVLDIVRYESGRFNISDLLTGKPSDIEVLIKDVRIRKGLLRYQDRFCVAGGLTTSLEDLELEVSSLVRGKTSRFKLATRIPVAGEPSQVTFSGSAKIPSKGKPLGEARLDLTLSLKNVDAGRYWPYYGPFIPLEDLRGSLDLEGTFRGKPTEFISTGSLRTRELRIRYPRVFHGPLAAKDLHLAYDAGYTPRKLSLTSLDLTVDGLRVQGSCILDDLQTSDPQIRASATTSPLRLEQFRQYIPFGIIAKDTADFIEQRIRGGVFRLEEGRVEGRVSQLRHLEVGDNARVLSVRARVDQGVLTLGPEIPELRAISGALVMEGKDFALSQMSGRFGDSPFTLEGKITGYPLDTPSTYPVIMTITPAPAEVAWLFRQDDPGTLPFSGPSTLILSGAGPADDYRLSGSWDLSRAAYRLPHLVDKGAGQANRLDFSASLDKTAARLSKLRYRLPPLEVDASASYRYGDHEPLSFAVATNRFNISPELPLLPDLRGYHASGTLRAELTGTVNPAAEKGIAVVGALSLAEFSLQPLEQMAPLRGISGTVHFTEDSLESEELEGMVGETAVTVKGRVASFSDPGIDVDFSSPLLHLKDFGFQSPGEEPEVRDLAGSILLHQGNLTLRTLSGQVNRSSFTARGEVMDLENPAVTLQVDFPFLRVEDLEALSRLERAGSDKGSPPVTALTAQVTCREGSFREVTFAHLDTNLSLERNRLTIQALKLSTFGGTVAGKGEVDFTLADAPRYQAAYHLERVDLAQLARSAGRANGISGQLTTEGTLTTSGGSPKELQNNARGTAKVHLQNGQLSVTGPSTGGAGVNVPYAVIDADLTLAEDTLAIEGFRAEALGGSVGGRGRVDFAAADGPLYQATYRLERVALAQLAKAAGREELVTGSLTAEGEVSARGKGPEQLRKTARGEAEVTLSDGSIPFPAGAGKGKAHKVPIKELQASISLQGNVLDIPSLRIEAFDGVISGIGVADFGIPDGPGYSVSCQMESVDAAKLFRTFRVTKDLSGRLNLHGEFTAKGNSGDALKKSLQGPMDIHLEKGVIRKYMFLSKVFSILNVSQLLDFQLPDLVSAGMPYNRIDGRFDFQDGVAATKDLSINSNSVNVTVVGTSDLIKQEIDLMVGVQPLQTVGKVVSRIPVVGWVLTGGDREFLVTYYEAKGNWDDPTVTAIPFTSLSTGALNIFKRAFSLPDKLFTEPGKVILNK